MTAQETTHDVVSVADLKALAEAAGPCISMAVRLSSALDLRLRLKNAIRAVKTAVPAKSPEGLIEPIEQLAETIEAGGAFANALLIFRSAELFRYYFVAEEAPEMQSIGPKFQVRSLLATLSREQRFHLLAITRHEVRLFHCGLRGIEQVKLSGPTNFGAWKNTRKPDHDLDNRSSAGQSVGAMAGVTFTTSSDRERENQYLAHFFKAIDREVHAALHGDSAPLLLAGTDDEVALYSRENTYPHLFEEHLHGSPENWNEHELHRQAMEIVRRSVSEPVRHALATYEKRRDKGHVAVDAPTALQAAWDGRVEYLLFSQTAQMSGSFNEETRQIEAARAGEDLINAAALQTILLGGQAFALDPQNMPAPEAAVALLRF